MTIGIGPVKRAIFWFHNFTANRPLCVLSLVGGVRDSLIGLGFLVGFDQLVESTLYRNFNIFIPGISGPAAGWLMILMGLVITLSALLGKSKYIRYGLRVQAFVWLFNAIMYIVHNDWILAGAFGLSFSIVAGYIAYYFKYGPLWEAQKKQFRDEWIASHDHLTHITDRARIDKKGMTG